MQSSGEITFVKKTDEEKKEKNDKEESDEEKIQKLLQKGQQTLLQIQTFFPFDLFPDTLIVDTNKVSLINSEFFYSVQVHSIAINDIGDVIVETSLLFAKLKIIDKSAKEESISMPYLKKGEALEARRIIEGLILANEQKIDLTKFSSQEITQKLEKIGKAL